MVDVPTCRKFTTLRPKTFGERNKIDRAVDFSKSTPFGRAGSEPFKSRFDPFATRAYLAAQEEALDLTTAPQ
jgi:hypothetical protein